MKYFLEGCDNARYYLNQRSHIDSPNRRGRNSIDHFALKPTGSPISTSPGLIHAASERSGTPSSATKHSVSIGGRGRTQRDGDPGIPGIGGIGPILAAEDSYDGVGVDSPMSHNGELHQSNGELLLDGGFGSEKSKPQIDVFSDKVVKIDEGGLDQIFASDEEDESQEVRMILLNIMHKIMCALLQGMEMNQFTFGDGRTGGTEHVDPSTNHKVSKVRTSSLSFYASLTHVFIITFRLNQ